MLPTHFWGGAAAPYQIDQSLRFNSADSAYLNRTFGTPTDNKKWTFSCWIKRSQLSVFATAAGAASLFCTQGGGAQSFFGFAQNVGNDLSFGYGGYVRIVTTGEFRDLSAWYHIVLVFDSANATPADRAIIYINGTRASVTTPNAVGLNDTTLLNSAVNTGIGRQSGQSWVSMDMYLAEVNFIDGSALTPSSFGETDTITGAWIPKKYSGIYGNNGFYLTFADNSNTTAATLGKDYSGNGNNWTPNYFSVTAGASNDVLSDTPTSNFCTWFPQQGLQTWTFSNGNLDAVNGNYGSFGYSCIGTMAVSSGKWYWEVKVNDAGPTGLRVPGVGIMGSERDVLTTSSAVRPDIYLSGNGTIDNSSGTALQSGFSNMAAGDIVGVAVDANAKTVQFYRNGSAVGTAQSYTAAFVTPSFYSYTGYDCNANFGQRAFAYTPPTGYKALNTANLPEPTIKKPSSYFDAKLYTGTGITQSITGFGFSPDLVWIKKRSAAENHEVQDSVRGATKRLASNTTDSETTVAGSISSFNSDGFTVVNAGTTNENTSTYAAWCWKKGATPGFDIVTYTGNGTTSSSRLIDHNLGVTPDLIITKKRSSGTTDYGWSTWHKDLGGNYGVWLHLTNARNVSMWAGYTNFSSTKFTPPDLNYGNELNQTYVNYLWAEVPGFSRIGKYIGNGLADGPFVYCGFRPAWLMIKSSSNTTNWYVFDTARNEYNLANKSLFPNLPNQENTGGNEELDIVSNGFKMRNASSSFNINTYTYIFAAFAEHPFKYANAR